jgi:plastocyanin
MQTPVSPVGGETALGGAALPAAPGTLVAQNTAGSVGKKSEAKGVIEGRVVAKPARYQANAVVYLQSVNGTFAPPSKPLHMDQTGMQFEPRVLAVLKGATVEFLNSDPAEHNIYTPDGEKYDLGKWNQGEKRSYTFGKAGTYTQLCKIHPAMIGYIVVVENPYFAVTSQDGSFQIAGVPPGEYTLLVWHERLKAIATKVTVEAGKSAEVEIPLAR